MSIANPAVEPQKRPEGIDYFTMSFLILTPILGVAGTAIYTWLHGFHLWMPILAGAMYLAVGLSITAGYHRFFSHKSYEASLPVQIFYAVFGAMAAQNSILWWSSSHRVHHQHVDQDWDPYSIKRGFWWAHILWVFHRHDAPPADTNATDLLKNPVVLWQDRWYKAILIVGGFGLPTLIGAAFGDPIAGLLWGGFLRLAVIHHTTFFVNSLAHYTGKPTYNAEVSSENGREPYRCATEFTKNVVWWMTTSRRKPPQSSPPRGSPKAHPTAVGIPRPPTMPIALENRCWRRTRGFLARSGTSS